MFLSVVSQNTYYWIEGSSTFIIALDVLFVFTYLVSNAPRFKKENNGSTNVKHSSLYTTLQLASFYLVLLNIGSAIWLAYDQLDNRNLPNVLMFVELVMQGLAWLISIIALHLTRAEELLQILRLWWIFSFFIILIQPVELLVFKIPPQRCLAGIVGLASVPANILLLWASIRGKTGKMHESGLEEPLLNGEVHKKAEDEVTPYSTAGIYSVLMFTWLQPVLAIGARRRLEPEDLPQLAEEHRAQAAYNKLEEEWEKTGPGKQQSTEVNGKSREVNTGGRSLMRTLVKCFWKEAALVGVLVVLNSVSQYVGPYLIDDFVTYLSGVRRFNHEGVILVTTFLVTKIVENFAFRQWIFLVQALAVKIRAALTACVYRKGLRLSNRSRQSHTSGEIVNYMAVDIQRVLDFTWYMHDLWMVPFQLVLALGILYSKVGLAAIATIIATILTVAWNAPFSTMLEKYQDEIMEAKDVRMRATTECLRSMKILKLQAWEKAYLKKLEGLRNVEYKSLKKSFYAQATVIFLYWVSPSIVGVFAFGSCVLLKIPLTTGRVLSALATFRILQEPLTSFPDCLAAFAQARVSVDRLSSYMQEQELQDDAVVRDQDAGPCEYAVQVEDGEFSWDGDKVSLHSINLNVQKGMTVMVCGVVGSGKSSLLSCLLGEMAKISGQVRVRGRTAYVGQTAWIQTGKIEDNVLFGSPMDRKKYDYVLEICQLKKDLEVLPYGDQTEIGERGINLSGGQKQRIQLARAVYQDADVYLLDDPFSAVDVQTATQNFKECVLGVLASKTVILVTHHMEFLPAADLILVLKDGHIEQSGKYNQLLTGSTNFNDLVGAHNKAMDIVNQAQKSSKSEDSIENILDNEEKTEEQVETKAQTEVVEKKAQLVQEEEREQGSVNLKVYWSYCTAIYKGGLIPCILAAQLFFQLFQIGSNWWMASETPTTKKQGVHFNSTRLIMGYGLFSLGASLFILLRVLLLNVIGLLTAQKFFFDMLNSLFHAPMSFFDSTPTGRILSRASTDQTSLDLDVPYRLGGVAFAGISLLCTIGVMSQAAWQVLIVFIPVSILCIMLQKYYIASGRELARIQGVQKAPIIHHFAESTAGAATIRGFEQEERFMKRNLHLIDSAGRAIFYAAAAMEWVSLRLELLTNVVFSFCLILLVSLPPGIIKPSLAGLAVTYGLNLNSVLSYFLWNVCNVEQKIISVERIQQYTRIPSEAPWEIEERKPLETWPSQGNVQLVNLQIRYNDNAPLVLHGLSCEFPGGKKIGVVGRTGSGKSTLIQAIFRIIEPAAGKIVIDGVDITRIGLHDLRSKLSIIPQDPTLFEGTVRYNLDPLGQYSDEQLWEALDYCQLGDLVRSKEEKLESAVTENGENWSVGQRQLFCLGRVMLKQARVLVLDEATASVDSATDGVIQSTISNKFQGCTVITIAHRIPTVVDSDYVLVLSDGRIAEYDQPVRLLERSSSHFFQLVSEYSKRSFG